MVISGFSITDVKRIGNYTTEVVFACPYDVGGDVYGRLACEKLWHSGKEWYLFDGEELEDFNRIIKPSGPMERVIFNPPATIVFWEDGTKTVVKCENEPFDAEKGIAMAAAKKMLTSKDYNRLLDTAFDYKESVCIDNSHHTRKRRRKHGKRTR